MRCLTSELSWRTDGNRRVLPLTDALASSGAAVT